MRFLIIFLLLTGCAETTATDSVIKSVYSQIDAIEQSLTPDCATDGIKANLGALKTQIQTVENTCKVDIDKVKQERIKWQVAFFSLLVIIGVFILKKVV